MKQLFSVIVALMLTALVPATAAVKMPAVFSDNMVLQQQSKVAVWGKANPKESITITTSWNGHQYKTKAAADGRWSVRIDTPAASTGHKMTVTASNTVVIENILFGEVWLCSGQSNMEYPTAKNPTQKWQTGMFDYEQVMQNATFDNLRLFRIERQLGADGVRDDCQGSWLVCTPENLKHFSAVGFIFGRSIHEGIKQPVGLIQASWGGTPAESWTPAYVMAKDPLYTDVKKQYEPSKLKEKDQCKVPATLWNGMINPILPYTIRGCIWYQGESNAERAGQYKEVFTNMITAWRKAWNAPEMPFYFVQIAPHYRQTPAIRQAQFDTWRAVKNTGMAVITDAGDSTDIHPRNKVIPGERLARWALNRTYRQAIACESPYYLSAHREGNALVVQFTNAEQGLKAADQGAIQGFMLAGADRRFYPATAKAQGDQIVLTAPQVAEPIAARYGWSNWMRVNLTNGAGLPAVPFRTDAWEAESYARRFADSEMLRFPQAWQLDHGRRLFFGYAQGVGCCAMLAMWKATGDNHYFDYVERWADSLIQEDGSIHLYNRATYNIDYINSGKTLFDLYRQTGKEKYRKAMDVLVDQMRHHPRTTDGGYWHKLIYQHQIWLDGLYMCSPFLAQYGKEFDKPEWIEEAVKQIKLCHKHTYDPATGLYHHAWDESRSQRWANPETGHSPNYWGRSIGWWFMALVDNLDFIPQEHPDRELVISLVQGLADSLPKYQDKNGLWYQVLDCPTRKGNFPEASVTTQFMYAYAKAVNKGYIAPSYRQYAEKAFNGLRSKLLGENADGSLTLTRCCAVGGLGGKPYRDGSFEYYIGERMHNNDAKATGPFIMGCLELGK